MSSSYRLPQSHFSTDTSPGFKAVTIETWSEYEANKATEATEADVAIEAVEAALSPRSTLAMARESSVYSTGSQSQSIMVFTDVEELLSPGIEEDGARELSDSTPSSKQTLRANSNLTLFPSKTKPKPSRLDSLTPKPLKLILQPEKTTDIDDSLPATPPHDLQESRINNLPRPPRRSFYHPKRILRFTGLFPESRISGDGQRSLANVDKILPQPPYHVFDLKRKAWLLVLLILITFLSPLSVLIYFPAIRNVATDFRTNNSVILATVTVQLLLHGVAPIVWGPLSERFGRRPVLIGSLIIIMISSIGLVFIKNIAGFFVLRILQAFGSGPLPTIAIYIIADVATGLERDRLMAVFGTALLSSFIISPVLGGAFTQMGGFRYIFGFLAAITASILIIVLVVLPETHRGIAGNGTLRLAKIRRPIWSIFRPSFYAAFTPNIGGSFSSLTVEAFVEPLYCFSQLEILPHLLVGAVVFAILVTVVSTTAVLFESKFRLSPILAGTAYIPAAIGSILGFFLMAYRLHSDYEIAETRFKRSLGIEEHISMHTFPVAGFPIERARLRSAWWLTFIFIGTTIGYGFCINGTSIAKPLALQFFLAASATALLMINSVLISDLFQSRSPLAIINLSRLVVGALFIGIVQPLINGLGTGVTFSILAGIMFGVSPVLVLQWIYGGRTKERRKISSEKFVPGAGIIL